MKTLWLLLILAASAFAQTLSGVNGDCAIGGQQVLTQGLASTGTKQIGTNNVLAGAGVMASFPRCRVTVYLTGTTNNASIYSDANSTVLANPFTANVDGSWTFFAAQGAGYDIVLSSGSGSAGSTLPYPRTLAGVFLGGSGGGGGGTVTGATTGGGLVLSGTTLGLRIDCGAGSTVTYNGTAWVCGGSIPTINVQSFGAVGNGTTDDTAAIQAAYNSCPQTSPRVGCNVFWPAGTYKITSAINQALIKGIHTTGAGSCGTGGCTTVIQTNGAIWGFSIGNPTSPNSNGFIFENIGFQDMTGNGLGGLDILATRDGIINDVACFSYLVGACVELDGGSNFTQFIHMIGLYTWHSKFRVQTSNKTASNYIWGGEGNCQNSGSTDVIAGSIDIDLGFTNHATTAYTTAPYGTASEYGVQTQTQNCQTGRALFDAGGNAFGPKDKAVEETINARPSTSFGVIVDGDTQSLANGNSFISEQVTKAGTGFDIRAFGTNTLIDNPVFNGTNGVDFTVDSSALTTTKINTIKSPTGWTTNVSAMSRASNVVTATTTASSDNGDLSVKPGTLLYVYNSTGGTTSFNGTFPLTSVSTNISTNITTLTWAQTGSNESATINTGACGGAGTCVTPLSSVLNSGVGVVQLTGDQITQTQSFQQPPVIPTVSTSTEATTFFDGVFFDIIEANGGVLHLSDGPGSRFTGSTAQSYTPQPTTTAGYGVAGVPNCSALITPNPQTAVPCPSSDDKGTLVATNTNGTTVCLPPPGTANGYPPKYSWSISFAPGTGPNYLSVTPPGHTSLYSISCAGTSATLDGSTSARNLSIQQGMELWTDGNNWFSIPGNPSIPVDQIAVALTTNTVNLDAGSFTGGGSAGAKGGSFNLGAGNTNDSTGAAGTVALGGNGQGHAPASGLNGATQLISTFQAGASTTGKEGSIARFCNDFTSDCSASVHVTKGAVRITISDTGDLCCAIGIISSGASIGNPTEVVTEGLYPAPGSTQTAPVSENSCTANEFYLISQVSSSTNGRGYCSTTDGPQRVGYTVGATSGTCNTSTPCSVTLWVAPAGVGTGSTTFTAAGDLSGTNTSQEVTGILSNNLPALTTGFLNWTGSAWAFSPGGGSGSVTITNGTGITGGGTGSSFTLAVTAPVVLTNQANTYTAGQKQTFVHNGTNAGLSLSAVNNDPSSLTEGDIWYEALANQLKVYDGTTKQVVMYQSTRASLAQLNNGAPAAGQVPYTDGANVQWLNPGTAGCYFAINSTPAPFWDSNLCSSAGNLTYGGTITATKFIGTGPYYLQTITPGGSPSLPGSGQSAFAVSTDGNFYISKLNASFGQVPFFSGAAAADQIIVGASAGATQTDTLSDCQDTTGNHLNYTASTHLFSCGTSTGIGFALTTGHLVAGVAGVAADAGTDFTLNTSTHTLATGASAITNLSASPAATGLKIPTSAGASPTVDGNIAVNSTTHTLAYGCNGATCTATQTIGSGTATMTTAGISTGACGTTVTVAATGVLTTDTINVSRNAAATIGNGGGLTLNWWVTSGNVNFNYCNSSAGTITPTAMTVNWNVTR